MTAPRDRGIAILSRGDPVTAPLVAALSAVFPVSSVNGNVDLRPWQRVAAGALSFTPSRRAWIERYYKSATAVALRSRNAERLLRDPELGGDLVLQVHALFTVRTRPYVTYVDCTHRQSAEHWPAWNPLSGRALHSWYEREADVYHGASHLFTFSEAARRSLRDGYGVPADAITVVGAGPALGPLPARTPPGDQDRPPLILFVGNDFTRKGGFVLLDAFRQVRRACPGAELHLVGPRVRLPPQPQVVQHGHISDPAALRRLFERASVFTLPSHFEPFGLVLVEAMSYALPCVATRSGGIPDVVDDGRTGVLVDRGDSAGLAEALIALLRDPARREQLGQAGRTKVETTLMWPHVVERMRPGLARSLSAAAPAAISAGARPPVPRVGADEV